MCEESYGWKVRFFNKLERLLRSAELKSWYTTREKLGARNDERPRDLEKQCSS